MRACHRVMWMEAIAMNRSTGKRKDSFFFCLTQSVLQSEQVYSVYGLPGRFVLGATQSDDIHMVASFRQGFRVPFDPRIRKKPR